MTTALERAKRHSTKKVSELRTKLKRLKLPKTDVVVACGSYARGEASEYSDIDFFVITSKPFVAEAKETPNASQQLEDRVRSTIREVVPIDPAAGGAFSALEQRKKMLVNIGGNDDSNQKITRRMLFLLEGEWLFNEQSFRDVRREILGRYVAQSMADHQLALFLLNDIIRYYRTMAVDYEFKTAEGDTPKPWGLRNIKLVFSRKLLYASGLFSVAMTADRSREEKINILERLFDMPVLDRMDDICGKAQMEGVRRSYNIFLERLEVERVRRHLEKLGKDQRDDKVFRELKNEGYHFTRELLQLFEDTFDSTHPIRRAVIV